MFATGNGRKTDPVDAHSVALRTPNLVGVQADPELVVMGMLVDRRDELGRARTQTVNRLHRLLLEPFPGGAKKFLSATQARALIATIKPREIVGKTRRRLIVELIAELEIIDKKMKAADKDLRELVIARGSTLRFRRPDRTRCRSGARRCGRVRAEPGCGRLRVRGRSRPRSAAGRTAHLVRRGHVRRVGGLPCHDRLGLPAKQAEQALTEAMACGGPSSRTSTSARSPNGNGPHAHCCGTEPGRR